MRVSASLLIVVLLAACARSPQSAAPAGKALSCDLSGEVKISDAWVRAQPDSQGMSAAYFSLCNGTDEAITLASAASPAATMVDIHVTTKDASGAMAMQPAGEILVMPGEVALFEPGGRHLMLMGLKGPIESGAEVELTLALKDGAAVAARAIAKTPAEAARAGQ